MPFQDLDEWFDSSLKLPIRGKTYRIESVDAATGVWCQRMMAVVTKAESGQKVDDASVDALHLDDDEEINLYERIMGDTYAEMIDDGLPWEAIKLAGGTTLVWITQGMEAAEQFWGAGGRRPEAARPEPQDHKAPARKARQGSTGSKKPQPVTVKGTVVTPGETSSNTGA